MQLGPGDLVVLFTDGITEAMRADGEEFGDARVLRVAADGDGCSPVEVKERLLAAVNQFCNSQLQDDATLLLIAAVGGDRAPEVQVGDETVASSA
jgi:sigma-B regulation protein RsbU (phosphoserine phosphatase)